jgi:hypothetical protein
MLGRHHNLVPDTAILGDASAPRRHMETAKLDALLARSREGAERHDLGRCSQFLTAEFRLARGS